MIFNYLYQKKATKLQVTLKTFRGKNQHLWESWFSRICRNVHLSDIHDRSEVIKIFHFFLYSLEIDLFKHLPWDKMWSRTIGELNLNWTMPEISNLKKPWKTVMALSICWTYLSGTLRADCIGVITSYMVVLYLVREYVEIFEGIW